MRTRVRACTAREAAWAVPGEAASPAWEVAVGNPESPAMGDDGAARVRELYAAVLAGSRPLLSAGKDWLARR